MKRNIQESVIVGEGQYQFSLCRKKAILGEVEIDHWWMPIAEVYHRSASKKGKDDRCGIAESFRSLCVAHETWQERDVRESYLLARLAGFTRTTGSRRIFADSILDPPGRARAGEAQARIQSLDQLIRASHSASMTWSEFQRTTQKALGPPKLTRSQRRIRRNVYGELFDEACDLLGSADSDSAFQSIRKAWQAQTRRFGRRAGHADEKLVLDVLSYESRAAVHRCYSAVWHMLILPHLTEKYHLSPKSIAFLSFWHLMPMRQPRPQAIRANFLFHGHVIALHPAMATFIGTSAGKKLLSEWLATPTIEPGDEPGRELLHGMSLAVWEYQRHRDEQRMRRKK